MQINVLEYLEKTVLTNREKTAFADNETELSFGEVSDRARSIGSYLNRIGADREPVVIYMKKSPCTITAFFGVIYAGCHYVPIDEEMPRRRMELILENTKAAYMIYDADMKEKADLLGFRGTMLSYEEIIKEEIRDHALEEIRLTSSDQDPIYILFTSGSTGVPKGVVGHHRGVVDYIESLSETLHFGPENIFGNQTPLYLDACMKEIYPTVKFGATAYLIPKEYFMNPVKLVEYLNEKKINTICWVVSALTMISAFGTFDEVKPEYLTTVAFGSEVFPVKQFNLWKETLPEAEFYNLYGPTEATGMSCYYHADHLFGEKEAIPVGRPFRNTQIFLLDEAGKKVAQGETGEICIRGTCLTHGYYNNPEKTAEAFTQNPLNPYFPDRIYHTGDLGYWNENGELVFASRKDYQIKHMGHRIELGEIEADANCVEGVKSCACIFLQESKKIILFYVGEIDKRTLTAQMKERLPRYMIPNAIMQVEAMPLTPNGKMDRIKMQEMYLAQKKERKTRKRAEKS